MWFSRSTHICDRGIEFLDTPKQVFTMSCSCGWQVADPDAGLIGRQWQEHLVDHHAAQETLMLEIEMEYEREFCKGKVMVER